jgi:hypothetical protein
VSTPDAQDVIGGPGIGATRRSLLLASGAFLLYGGWAFMVNRSHGTGAGSRALVVQGSLSFLSTLTITMLMEWAYGRTGPPWIRVGRAFLGGCLPMYTLTIGVHVLVGTPEVVATVAPVLALGTAYCAVYSLSLTRLRQPRAAEDASALSRTAPPA